MARQAGVEHFRGTRVLLEKARHGERVPIVLADAQIQGLEPLEQHPGIERAERRAGVLEVRLQDLRAERRIAQDRAAQTAALTVDVLGRRVHHQIGAQLERPLQDRAREHVVDDHLSAGLVRQLGDRRDVDQGERRIARRLEKHEPGGCGQGLGPLIQIAAVDQDDLDPEARQDLGQDVVTGAEQEARCHDAIAGTQLAAQGGMHRGHAGRRGRGLLGALEQRKTLLEHPDGRVGDPRVHVARRAVGEPIGGVLGAPVAEARGEEQRLRGLAEPRALGAAVDQPGPGPPGLAHLPCLQNKSPRPRPGRARPRPFSSLFSVACKPAGPNHHVRSR